MHVFVAHAYSLCNIGLRRGHLVWRARDQSYAGLFHFDGNLNALKGEKLLTRSRCQVASSIIAAWADISDALAAGDPAVVEAASALTSVTGVVSKMNIGYFWMFMNCGTSAAYVSAQVSCNGVRFTETSDTGLDDEEEDQGHRLF